MKPISDLTYKILVSSDLYFKADVCVDWAVDMLKLGYDTENLRILAGITKPARYDEIDPYLKQTLKELGLKELSGDEGVRVYCTYLVKNIIYGTEMRESLHGIYEYCMAKGMESSIIDFYSLYYAWQDLDESENQYYCKGANRANIKQIVLETAKNWLEKNEKYIS